MFADDFVHHDWTVPEPIRDKETLRANFMASQPPRSASTTTRSTRSPQRSANPRPTPSDDRTGFDGDRLWWFTSVSSYRTVVE